jgi:hypothetical protein
MARVPESLQIALWIVGSVWLLAILALLFGFDVEVIWTALVFGTVVGFWEWKARR